MMRDRAVVATELSFTISDPARGQNPLVWVNPAFTRLTGYDLDEVLGRNCRFLQGPNTDPTSISRIRSALADERPAVRRAFDNGLAQLTEVFRDCLLENVKDRLCSGDAAGAQRASALLAAESPQRWARLAGRWSTVD